MRARGTDGHGSRRFARLVLAGLAAATAGCPPSGPPTVTLGAACASDADCVAGFVCDVRDAFPGGLCTVACADDADCEDFSDFPGVCTAPPGGRGVCLRGCPAALPNACRREGWICAPGAYTHSACLPHCDAAGCPDGFDCAAGTGLCAPLPGDRAAYDRCGPEWGRCAPGLACLTFVGTPDARCHRPCAADVPCGAGEVCAIELPDGSRACAPACETDADCGDRGRCLDSTRGARCLPVVAEGPRAAQEVCGRAAGEQCGPGLACVVRRPGRGRGLCLAECETFDDCPGGLDCAFPLEGAAAICTGRCDSAGGFPCPRGARCVYGGCLPL